MSEKGKYSIADASESTRKEDFQDTNSQMSENTGHLLREDITKKMKLKTLDLEQSLESTSSRNQAEEAHLSDNSLEYSFRNARLRFKTEALKSPEEEKTSENYSKIPEPPNKIPLKKTESRMTKMVEKCAKVVSDLASGIRSTWKGNVRKSFAIESSSSFDGGDTSTEMAKKYRKLLNNDKVQQVQGSKDRTESLLSLAEVEMERPRTNLPEDTPRVDGLLNTYPISSNKNAYKKFRENLTSSTDSDESDADPV